MKLTDPIEDQLTPDLPPSRPSLALMLAALIIVVGVISFIYSGGSNTLRSTLGFLRPAFTLTLAPEAEIIPADGTSQIYLDVIAQNKKGQLLDGSAIVASIADGTTDLVIATDSPTDVSQRFLLTAPDTPQPIEVLVSFRGLKQTLTFTAFDPTPPATPALKAPFEGATLTTALPVISGQGVPETVVEIHTDDGLNTTTEADKDGVFKTTLERALGRGSHKLTLRTLNRYNVASRYSAPITFEIQTPDPQIDLTNLLIKPNPAIAGQAFYIFVPVSSDTKSAALMIDETSFDLSDPNSSSIFSGIIPTPKTAGLYNLSLIVTNAGGDSTFTQNFTRLVVTS